MNGLVQSEWVKFSSLRGSWIRLLTALALDLAVVIFGLWFFNRAIGDVDPDTGLVARVNVLTGGVSMAAIVMVIVGVVAFTGEIKSRSIIPSITAAPNRTEFVGAKTIIVGLVGLATGIVVVLLNTSLSMVTLDLEGFPLSLDDTDVARVLVGSVVFLTLAALFGLGVGLVANSQTLGVALGVIWPTALESSLSAFLPDWVDRFLPFKAGAAMLEVPANPDLPPWEGGAVFLLWSATAILVGGTLFKRRDLGSS